MKYSWLLFDPIVQRTSFIKYITSLAPLFNAIFLKQRWATMKFNSYLHSFQYVLPCWVIYVLVYLSSGRWCSCLLSIFTGSTGQKNKIACILHLYLLVFLHKEELFWNQSWFSIHFNINVSKIIKWCVIQKGGCSIHRTEEVCTMYIGG